MKSLDEPKVSKFSEVVKVLNRISLESENEAVESITSLLRRVDREYIESLLRILRMDFGEASRLLGTSLMKKIVSEAVASITSLKLSEVEELIEAGRISGIVSKKSSVLTEEGLSIGQVYQRILEACRIRGKGSISSKSRVLASLLSKSSEEEAIFIINMLTRGRKVVSDELLIRALEETFNTSFRDNLISEDFYEKVKRMIEECRMK
ncbi:MAG: hypothetical protein JTT15_04895 [Candidatus Brockarchaeota archaeon]|nr:hypothetical protein [Candidatus Brockarchaeota archaeon]